MGRLRGKVASIDWVSLVDKAWGGEGEEAVLGGEGAARESESGETGCKGAIFTATPLGRASTLLCSVTNNQRGVCSAREGMKGRANNPYNHDCVLPARQVPFVGRGERDRFTLVLCVSAHGQAGLHAENLPRGAS